MKINDCTIEELKEKIDNLLKENYEPFLKESLLKKYDLSYFGIKEKTKEKSQLIIYFPCKNGVAVTVMEFSKLFKYYKVNGSRRISDIRKVNSEELEKVASKLYEIEKEKEKLDTILNAEKLRGFFAKINVSNS